MGHYCFLLPFLILDDYQKISGCVISFNGELRLIQRKRNEQWKPSWIILLCLHWVSVEKHNTSWPNCCIIALILKPPHPHHYHMEGGWGMSVDRIIGGRKINGRELDSGFVQFLCKSIFGRGLGWQARQFIKPS